MDSRILTSNLNMCTEFKMHAIPTAEDLQKPRIPSDLRSFVMSALNTIALDQASKEAARLWLGRAKELLREILPMSFFVPWRWPGDDVLIQPRLGNQGYDAQVLTLDGKPLTALEVSWAVDGQAHKEKMIALNKTGGTVGTFGIDERIAAVDRTLLASRIKSRKDYRNCLLLLVFDVLPLFQVEDDKHWAMIEGMHEKLLKQQFKASEVYLLLVPPDYVASKGRDPIKRIDFANDDVDRTKEADR
jgi:hypothetical protein